MVFYCVFISNLKDVMHSNCGYIARWLVMGMNTKLLPDLEIVAVPISTLQSGWIKTQTACE